MPHIRIFVVSFFLVLMVAGCGPDQKDERIGELEGENNTLKVVVTLVSVGAIVLWIFGAAMGSRARKASESHRKEDRE